MPKEYRGRTRIVHDILRAIKEEPGIGITRLLYVSNLSHERLTDYVRDLQERTLVVEREVESRRTFDLTDKGRTLLLELGKIRGFMADFGLDF